MVEHWHEANKKEGRKKTTSLVCAKKNPSFHTKPWPHGIQTQLAGFERHGALTDDIEGQSMLRLFAPTYAP